MGIDAGSTTSKMILLDDDNNIRFQFYDNNKGKPLDAIVDNLKIIYEQLEPGELILLISGITGYGEDFIKAALDIDQK